MDNIERLFEEFEADTPAEETEKEVDGVEAMLTAISNKLDALIDLMTPKQEETPAEETPAEETESEDEE